MADYTSQYCRLNSCSTSAYRFTVTRTGTIGHVDTGASAAAVQRAVKLVDGDGICAVRVVIALHTNITSTCKQECCMWQVLFVRIHNVMMQMVSVLLTHIAKHPGS